jgi:chorismate mutase
MDEVPFFPDVAREKSVLPRMDEQYDLGSMRKSRLPSDWNAINYSQRIRTDYVERIMPSACCYAGRPSSPSVGGEDEMEEGQVMGSAALCDVSVLQALSRRIHFGKFVAEAKFRGERPRFEALIRARGREGIGRAITDEAVEKKVLERMATKARVYGADPSANYAGRRLDVEGVVRMYKVRSMASLIPYRIS